MNGFTRTPSRIGAVRLLWLGPVLLGLGLCGSNRGFASAIHHADKDAAMKDMSNPSWSEYLLGGPTVWSAVAHPALTPAIEAEMWKSIRSDPPPNPSAVVQFFLYKQSLDPARFDHYHPRVAASLAKIKAELATSDSTPSTSTSTSSTPTVQAQQITPPATSGASPDAAAVPEPATILLTIGMTGYAVWWRRRRD
jgi:PEP-CTERM motif